MTTKKLVINNYKTIEISTKKIWNVMGYDPCIGHWTQSFATKESAEACFLEEVEHLFETYETEIDDFDRDLGECLSESECVIGNESIEIVEAYLND